MLKKITGKSVTWTALDEMSPDALARLEGMVRGSKIDPGVPFIKNNTVRSAFLLEPNIEGYPRLFVKWFKKPVALQRIRYLFVPSKALAEWRNLRTLENRGLPCPRPLAFFEKRSCGLLKTACLVIEGLENAQPLNEFNRNCKLAASQKFNLTRQLARLSAAMHAAGIFSRDYHAGNIMIRPAGEGNFELFLIDLHKARVRKKLRLSMILTDCAKLSTSLPASFTTRLRFAQEYYRHASLPAMPLNKFVRRINDKAARIKARQILSRSKRCVLKSSVFEVAQTWKERYCGQRDFGHNAARALIAQHLNERDDQKIIKKTSKSTLTTHDLKPGEILCVKGYRYRGIVYALLNMFRKSRALKSWINANGFIVRGMLTPQPLAMIEKRSGPLVRENFYICRWLEKAPELNTYIIGRQWPEPVKKRFIKCLAETIITLHARGIYHGDLKSNNILVCEKDASWDFFFIDLDRVSFSRPLTFQRRTNNLAQINASISDIMTPRDRLRFFRIYSKAAACYTDRKRYFERILTISRTKNTQSYGLDLTKQVGTGK